MFGAIDLSGADVQAVGTVVSGVLGLIAFVTAIAAWRQAGAAKKMAAIAEKDHRFATEPALRVHRDKEGRPRTFFYSGPIVFYTDRPAANEPYCFLVEIANYRETPAHLVSAALARRPGRITQAHCERGGDPATIEFPLDSVEADPPYALRVEYRNPANGETGTFTAELHRDGSGWHVENERQG